MSDHSNSEIPNGSYYVDVAVLAKIFAKRYGTSVNAAYEWLTKDVEAPSANVQPVVQGEWIVFKAPDALHCGLVKCPFCSEELIAEPDEYHYCPNCGAKMGKRKGADE